MVVMCGQCVLLQLFCREWRDSKYWLLSVFKKMVDNVMRREKRREEDKVRVRMKE